MWGGHQKISQDTQLESWPPTEEELDVRSRKPLRVQEDAGPYPQGVGSALPNLFLLRVGVEVVDVDRDLLHKILNVIISIILTRSSTGSQ